MLACEEPNDTERLVEPEPLDHRHAMPSTRISLSDLLEGMSDMASLAREDSTDFSSRLASSYDREAKPEEDAWSSNMDSAQYIRVDGDEYVMMETDGPGVITRIWSANASGTIRIYLNGETQPAIEAAMDSLLSGDIEPFVPPFAFRVARGYNFYFPVAFQNGARVTTTADGLYYHVDYRHYPAGVAVESFQPSANYQERCAYKAAKARLEGPQTFMPSGSFVADSRVGEWVRLGEAVPGAVTWLELRPERTDAASLRGTILELRFDDIAAVRAPLGDFFGSGLGRANNVAVSMSRDGTLTSRFVMPFLRSAELRISRATAEGMRVRASYRVDPRPSKEALLYFRAGWTGVQTLDLESPKDVSIMRVKGRGHYVGVTLNVANPDPAWWGEGDEKIFVDGEAFPSHFGTGTEDYFGYAFCSTERFTTAFNGQTRANQTNNAGYVSLYRIAMLDRIPFSRSLRFDLEALHWATTHYSVQMRYDAVYYWYGNAEAVDLNEPPSKESWIVPELPEGTVEESGSEHTSCG